MAILAGNFQGTLLPPLPSTVPTIGYGESNGTGMIHAIKADGSGVPVKSLIVGSTVNSLRSNQNGQIVISSPEGVTVLNSNLNSVVWQYAQPNASQGYDFIKAAIANDGSVAALSQSGSTTILYYWGSTGNLLGTAGNPSASKNTQRGTSP